jgi:hypothetical protein
LLGTLIDLIWQSFPSICDADSIVVELKKGTDQPAGCGPIELAKAAVDLPVPR